MSKEQDTEGRDGAIESEVARGDPSPKAVVNGRVTRVRDLYVAGKEDQLDDLRLELGVSKRTMRRYVRAAMLREESLYPSTRRELVAMIGMRLNDLYQRAMLGDDFTLARLLIGDLARLYGITGPGVERITDTDGTSDEDRDQARRLIEHIPIEIRVEIGRKLIEAEVEIADEE